ncbi:unnamed protein product [Clonostachys rosea f. rosea IK726]|uniref:Uncharacterized protein n=1 Tax=Clonostachys rosea f. rosea IK726 TaxID=1349383 RepID=A0ACA9UQG0_BIOOC|nr:unnamed protein product [Clonostachys rosea f. rosea IK726]
MIFPKLLVPVLGLTTYVSAAALESVRAEPIGKVEVFNTAHCTGTAIKTIDVLTREDCIQFGDSGFSSVKWTSYRDIDKSYSLVGFTDPTPDCTGSGVSVSDSTGCAYVLSDWAKLYAGRLYSS